MEAIAVCKWFEYDDLQLKWVPEDGTEECRASVGKSQKIVTVWLPRGTKIRCGLNRINPKPFEATLVHFYGFHTRKKIEIKLRPVQ